MPSSKANRWLKRVAVTLIVLFVLYALGGFFGVPLILRYVGLAKMNEVLAGTGEVEAFRFNPFTWELKIEGFTGKTPDGETAVQFDEFLINIQPTSVFADAYEVHEILLDRPYLSLIVDENGKVNIASLVGKIQEHLDDADGELEEVAPFVIPHLKIGSIEVRDAGFLCQIDSFGQPFERKGEDISFVMTDLQTVPTHDNPYSFSLLTAKGEHVSVEGSLRLDPLSSVGALSVETLDLPDFSTFGKNLVGVEIASGTVDVSMKYNFQPLGENPKLSLENGTIALRDFSLQARGQDEPFQSVDSLLVKGMGFDLLQDHIHLDSVVLEGGSLVVVRDGEGVLNLIRYIAPPETQRAAAEQAQKERKQGSTRSEIRLGVAMGDTDLGVALTSAWEQIQLLVGLKWDLNIGELSVANQSLTWRDDFLARPAELRWTEINLKATDLSNGEREPFPFNLSMLMNESGSIALDGTFTADPAASSVQFEVSKIPLEPVGRYLDSLAPVRVKNGSVSATGTGEIEFPDKGLPIASAKVEASVAEFQLDWAEPAEPFLAFDEVIVTGANATSEPLALVAQDVTVNAPRLWAERLSDGSIRLPLPVAAADSVPAPASVAEEGAPAAPPPEGPLTLPFSAEIERFVVNDGVVRVKDAGVQPAANFAVTNIQMTAGPLSIPEPQPLQVDLSMQLAEGPSGTVKVRGSALPLQPLEATEVSVETDGVTMAAFAAYAVPIIGHPTTGGSVTAKLGYKVNQGLIDGTNDVKIREVKFGPRVKDSKAPNLPLELGVAILEDPNGVMNIDVPVSGDTNDPSFTIDRMIAYAIGNVVEKLVSAPFQVLGGLVPGGAAAPENFVEFDPGQITLPSGSSSGIVALASALKDRPGLALKLKPSIAPGADREALRGRSFEGQIATKVAGGLDREDAIEALYDDLPEDRKVTTEGQVTPAAMAEAVRGSIEVTPSQLGQLAQARADAVQLVLQTEGGIEPSRINIVTPEGAQYFEEGARVDFGLGVLQGDA